MLRTRFKTQTINQQAERNLASRTFTLNQDLIEYRLANLNQTPIDLFSKGVFQSKSGEFFIAYIIAQSGSADVMSEYCGRVHPSSNNTLNLTPLYEGSHSQAPRLASNGELTANSYTADGLYVRVILIQPEPIDV